ncbi:hypothetical protein [Nitrospira sp. Nam74]
MNATSQPGKDTGAQTQALMGSEEPTISRQGAKGGKSSGSPAGLTPSSKNNSRHEAYTVRESMPQGSIAKKRAAELKAAGARPATQESPREDPSPEELPLCVAHGMVPGGVPLYCGFN